MKVVFHPGPHKTGTTSIQFALWRLFGAKQPTRFWYPLPSDNGVQHVLAHKTLGLRGYAPDPEALRAVIEAARSGGTEILLISSEAFDNVITLDRFAPLCAALRGCDIHLIITANPLARRSTSLWQQLLKTEWTTSLRGSKDKILSMSAMRPDFVDRFIEALQPSQATLIVSAPGDPPERLIENFFAAAGVGEFAREHPDYWRIAKARRNTSFSAFEATLVRNSTIATRWAIARRRRRRFFSRLFRQKWWRASVSGRPIRVPEAWLPALEARAADFSSRLKALEEGGKLRIVGSLDGLGGAGPR